MYVMKLADTAAKWQMFNRIPIQAIPHRSSWGLIMSFDKEAIGVSRVPRERYVSKCMYTISRSFIPFVYGLL